MIGSSSHPLLTDSDFAELKRFIIEATGLVYFRDKDADLAQRTWRRCEARGVRTAAAYLEILRAGPDAAAEFEALATELTIGETYFFRHEDQFADLRTTILPALIARNQDRRQLRLWCAGCSIGAEPYSLSILLREHFGAELLGWDVRIIATDINRQYLEKAERGVFDEWSFRTTDLEFRRRHFNAAGKGWEIKPAYRAGVEFRYHNLMTNPGLVPGLAPGEVDLVTCRNVMIYFDIETITRVIPLFEDALGPGGWLVIGHAEQTHGARRLEQVQMPLVTAYRKTADQRALVNPFAIPFTNAFVEAFAPRAFEWPVSGPSVIPTSASAGKPTSAASTRAARPDFVAPDGTAYLRTLANGGEFRHALKYADELIAREPANAAAHYYRALVHEHFGNARAVEADLARAIGLDPTFVMAQYYAGLFFDRRGAFDLSRRHFRAVDALLGPLKPDDALPEGDGLRASDLREIITQRLGAA